MSGFAAWANKTNLDDFTHRANLLSDAFTEISTGATLSASQIRSLGLGDAEPTIENIVKRYKEVNDQIDKLKAKISGGMTKIDFSNVIDVEGFEQTIDSLIATILKGGSGGKPLKEVVVEDVEDMRLAFENWQEKIGDIDLAMQDLAQKA